MFNVYLHLLLIYGLFHCDVLAPWTTLTLIFENLIFLSSMSFFFKIYRYVLYTVFRKIDPF